MGSHVAHFPQTLSYFQLARCMAELLSPCLRWWSLARHLSHAGLSQAVPVTLPAWVSHVTALYGICDWGYYPV